jgi:hypothetical protein
MKRNKNQINQVLINIINNSLSRYPKNMHHFTADAIQIFIQALPKGDQKEDRKRDETW